jgi:small subunit ribosomal protein S20
LANHASAIKRHKQSEKRRLRNATVKSSLRTAVKKVTEAVTAGKADEAKTNLQKAVSELDRAVTKKLNEKK